MASTTRNTPVSTPWSMPFRTSAGMAMLASASSASSTSPMIRPMANGRSTERSLNRGAGWLAQPTSTPGVSVAGGSASTRASSSGEAGTPAIMLVSPAPPPPPRPPVRPRGPDAPTGPGRARQPGQLPHGGRRCRSRCAAAWLGTAGTAGTGMSCST